MDLQLGKLWSNVPSLRSGMLIEGANSPEVIESYTEDKYLPSFLMRPMWPARTSGLLRCVSPGQMSGIRGCESGGQSDEVPDLWW